MQAVIGQIGEIRRMQRRLRPINRNTPINRYCPNCWRDVPTPGKDVQGDACRQAANRERPHARRRV